MQEIAPGISLVSTLIANAYLIGTEEAWVLVDSCTPGHDGLIRRSAARRFGNRSRPRAILLTHGHFDHAGSAGTLADFWNVPIYAHPLEMPFLTGESTYPPFNLSSPGFFTRIARFFPTSTVNLGNRVRSLDPCQPVPGLAGWEVIETPGHTPGHIALFRPSDRVLLAGDTVTTMNLDKFWETVLRRKQVCRPPVPATMNWQDAKRSIESLARLSPQLIAAGHGNPMHSTADQLSALAANFRIPTTSTQK